MTIEEIQPYLQTIIIQLGSLQDSIVDLQEHITQLSEIASVIVLFLGMIAGLKFMSIFWRRFK